MGDHPVFLKDGSVKSVIVRLSWSDPFSSTIGLSLNGLHLALALRDQTYDNDVDDNAKEDLSQSVAHVADELIHEELTSNEESLLRDAIHEQGHIAQDTEDYQSGIPGSLGPMQSEGAIATPPDRTNDPEGVSIFAGLIEKILSRFSFNAEDIRITLLHEASALYTLRANKVHYFTSQERTGGDLPNHDETLKTGEKRVLRIDGFWLGVRNLKSDTSPPASPSVLTAQSVGHHSASRATERIVEGGGMSESILSLPPRDSTGIYQSPSFSSSVASSIETDRSMYESALEEANSISRSTPREKPQPDWDGDSKEEIMEEEPLLVINEPVEVSLLTPPPYNPDNVPDTSEETGQKGGHEKIRLVVSVGIVAIAARAQNLNLLFQMSEILLASTSHSPQTNNSAEKTITEETSSPLDQFHFTAKIKDIIMLMYNDEKNDSREHIDAFFTKPLVPTSMSCGYTRLHIDLVELTSVEEDSHLPTSIEEILPSDNQTLRLTVSDISLLAFHPMPPSSSSKRNKSSPILVCDPFLSESYHHKESAPRSRENPAHAHSHPESPVYQVNLVPEITLVDWLSEDCQEHGTNLRHWRTRAPHLPTSHYRHSLIGRGTSSVPAKGPLQDSVQASKANMASVLELNQGRDPAILVTFSRKRTTSVISIAIKPIHVFLDLGLLPSVMAYLDTIYPPLGSLESDQLVNSRDSDAETTTAETARDLGRGQTTQLASDGLDLELDYSSPVDVAKKRNIQIQVFISLSSTS